jgi:hypothetical protein
MLDGALLLDDLEDGRISLLLGRRQLRQERITRAPATTTNESGPTKEQEPNQTGGTGDIPTYPQDPVTTWRWSLEVALPPQLPPGAGS